MDGYPVVLRLQGRDCLIVGGGKVAERKALALLEGGADRLTAVSPTFTTAMLTIGAEGRLTLLHRDYEDRDAEGRFLVIAATDKERVNRMVGFQAEAAGALFSDASSGQQGSFTSSAAVRSGGLLLMAHTGGEAPALAAVVREELELLYRNSRYAEAVKRVGELRRRLRDEGMPAAERRERLQAEARRLADWAAEGRSRDSENKRQ